jgi:hypothetical protein
MTERVWITTSRGHSYPRATWDGRAWTPGPWFATPKYIVCRTPDVLLQYLHDEVWVAELDASGERMRVLAGTSWNATTARLFNVECAALMLGERTEFDATLCVAFRYACGDATLVELRDTYNAIRNIEDPLSSLVSEAVDPILTPCWAVYYALKCSVYQDATLNMLWQFLSRWLEL